MKETLWKSILAAISAGALAIFGGWDMTLKALAILMGLDIVSGVIRGFVQQQLSSKVSFRGIGKKFCIALVVALAVQVDMLAGTDGLMRNAIVIFYCASEGLSIVENVVAAGLPVPDILRDALAQLNEEKVSSDAVSGEHADSH